MKKNNPKTRFKATAIRVPLSAPMFALLQMVTFLVVLMILINQ